TYTPPTTSTTFNGTGQLARCGGNVTVNAMNMTNGAGTTQTTVTGNMTPTTFTPDADGLLTLSGTGTIQRAGAAGFGPTVVTGAFIRTVQGALGLSFTSLTVRGGSTLLLNASA